VKRVHDRAPEHAFPAALPEGVDEATDVASEFDLAVLEVESERRRMQRVTVRRPLLVVPVLPNGKPDWEGRNEGVSVDVSMIGLRMLLERGPSTEARELVLVVPEAEGTVRCAGLEIKHVESFSPQHVEVGAQVGGFADQLFRSENLTPRFRHEQGTFGLGLPEELLEAWATVGLLERRVFDRVSLCPRCRSLPTFRRGCSNCGAAVGLTQDELLHHFACAYVGPLADFQHDDVLQCPKCRTRHLVIGADYENLPGMFRCSDCHWSGDEPCSVGHCMRCHFRFPAQQAVEIELKGYHVERLDPLALAAAS
jgi:hypothetical protein